MGWTTGWLTTVSEWLTIFMWHQGQSKNPSTDLCTLIILASGTKIIWLTSNSCVLFGQIMSTHWETTDHHYHRGRIFLGLTVVTPLGSIGE